MKNNNTIFDGVLLVLGSISIVYFCILLCTISFHIFLLIYPLFSTLTIGFAILELHYKKSFFSFFSKWVQVILVSFVSLIVISFLTLEGMFIYQTTQSSQKHSDYIIVLGAQVNGTSLSPSLQYRLDATVSYCEEHPAIIVVSGGQGVGEDDSEANIMKQYLIQKGIPPNNIITEDKSTNTYENLLYSKHILDTYQSDYTVTIITNGFHCYRSLFIANTLGYNASTYAATEYAITTPHYYIREYFAYIKDFVSFL